MHLGVGIQASVGQDGEPVVQVSGLAQGGEHHAAGGDACQYQADPPRVLLSSPRPGLTCSPHRYMGGFVAEQTRDPAAYAADIDAARDRMIAFVGSCTEQEWRAAPLDGDPRPVAVVVDHVADAYDYLSGWMRQLVAGQQVEVDSNVVDDLNARHAQAAAAVTQASAADHLRRSGAAISGLVAGLSAADLTAGDARVRRLAQIAARHADDHRAEIEAALAAHGLRRA